MKKEAKKELSKTFAVTSAPFGWYKSFSVDVKGHPLSELSREITSEGKVKSAKALEDFKPQIVFHAAAYKSVDMLEYVPEEAIMTNVVGTLNVLDYSKINEIEKQKKERPVPFGRAILLLPQKLSFHLYRRNQRRKPGNNTVVRHRHRREEGQEHLRRKKLSRFLVLKMLL